MSVLRVSAEATGGSQTHCSPVILTFKLGDVSRHLQDAFSATLVMTLSSSCSPQNSCSLDNLHPLPPHPQWMHYLLLHKEVRNSWKRRLCFSCQVHRPLYLCLLSLPLSFCYNGEHCRTHGQPWKGIRIPSVPRFWRPLSLGISFLLDYPPHCLSTLCCYRINAKTKQDSLETAAAAAKSLQSCLTLCDRIEGSPPGSPVPGSLQARTLEWVAISFSNAWKWKVKVKSLSRVRLSATPWTAAYQAPPSMGFSRQDYWSGVPLPSLLLRLPPHKGNHLYFSSQSAL